MVGTEFIQECFNTGIREGEVETLRQSITGYEQDYTGQKNNDAKFQSLKNINHGLH